MIRHFFAGSSGNLTRNRLTVEGAGARKSFQNEQIRAGFPQKESLVLQLAAATPAGAGRRKCTTIDK
jgi:hypothetical protein